ncbi:MULTISPECIES: HAD family hydrolase [Acinetobacter]|jgi:putative hydrolase of the HAD superfamily|uniref:Haloacid dehalogenase, type II n=1 Tax=Acinetobacter schindleri CIP 107287 TaxID=1217988 RepID=N8Z4W4_9GAMM|nr:MULTISPECIES: HAD family hydrolase [Acinetobacter]ENV43991.1 haloacid dehalogenase, type II [Acinetobacter schindleri CIP 107287]MCK8641245.1 HAD family hydrolase [Acinetobacter schindleri]
MPIQAVLFDLDNTLTHRDLTAQAYSRYLAEYYAPALAQVESDKIIEIVRRIDNGGYPKKELLTHSTIGGSVAFALLQELSWQSQPALEELSDFWFQYFGQFAVAMPQAENLLQSLKASDYKLAIISNGGHDTRMNIINGLGFAHYFDEIMSSGLVGISKPNPKIFQYTAQKLAVAPEHCLYIGDHPVNDIQGAQNAGMQTLWMEGFHTPLQQIEHKIQNLAQVLDYLKH